MYVYGSMIICSITSIYFYPIQIYLLLTTFHQDYTIICNSL